MNELAKSQGLNLKILAVRMVKAGGGAETSFKNLTNYIAFDKKLAIDDLCFSDFKRDNKLFAKIYLFFLFIFEIRRRSCTSDRLLACVEGVPFLLIFIATLGLKKPIFLWLHCEPSVYKNYISVKDRIFIRLSIYLSRKIICASPWFARHHAEALSNDKRIHFLPNFVDDNRIKNITQLKNTLRIKFVYVGSLSRLKNVSACFDFFRLESSNAKFVFDIYGDGPNKEKLFAEAEKLSNFASINFKGHVDVPWKELSSNSILLVPSHTEALPMVIVEALAWGVPVIINKYKGYEFFSLHGGIVEAVNFNMPNEVRMAAHKILGYTDCEYQRCAANSMNFIGTHFNNEKNLKNLILFFNSCN